MKSIIKIWLLCLPLAPLFSQDFYLKLDDAAVTNSGTKMEVAVYMAGSASFELGSANLEFLFDSSLVEAVVLKSHEFDVANFSVPTVTEPLENKVALNIILNNENNGKTVTAHSTWTKLATVEFDVKNPSSEQYLDLCWSYDGSTKETVVFLDDEVTQIYVDDPVNNLSGVAQMPLPIELSEFRAKWTDETQKIAQLSWATFSEINSDYFEIQRSQNGRNWAAAKAVLAAGFSSTFQTYQTFDESISNLPFSLFYYRLKMIDFDGSAEYSEIISLARTKSIYDLKVRPTVFENQLIIELNEADFLENEVEISLIDLNGKLIRKENFEADNKLIMNDLGEIGNGIYFLEIQNNRQVFTQKLIKNL